MSTHALSSQMEEKLLTEINNLKQQIREMRTVQPSSANAIQIVGYPDPGVSVIIDVIPANSVMYHSFYIQPYDNRLTNWNFFLSVYVDLPGVTTDINYKLPFGSSLSTAQKNMRISTWPDWGASDDSIGMRAHIVEIENRDSNPHNIVVAGKFYGPYIEVL